MYKLVEYCVINWWNKSNKDKGVFDKEFESESLAILYLNRFILSDLGENEKDVTSYRFKIEKRYKFEFND